MVNSEQLSVNSERISFQIDKEPVVGLELSIWEEGFEEALQRLLHPLQDGFIVDCMPDFSIQRFLRDRLALDPDYISLRISTVFLDSKPVDDLNNAILRDGSTLALSGAMPGLVGAVMRRGGFYASFRDGISHKKLDKRDTAPSGPEDQTMFIRLKLFNLVMKELGPGFLRGGIYLDLARLLDFLLKRWPDFPRLCRQATIHGQAVEPGNLEYHPMVQNRLWCLFSVNREQ